MIAYLYGILVAVSDSRIIINCNGTGFEVAVGASYRQKSPKLNHPNEVFVLHQVTDKSQVLFGFASLAERDMAVDIVDEVDGVGPKGAHTFVSTAGYDAIAKAVMSGDAGGIKVKGFGADKVSRIITALRKVGRVTAEIDPRVGKVATALRTLGHQHENLNSVIADVARRHPDLDTGEVVVKVLAQLKSP